jgi:biotin carboxylase
MLIVSSSSYRTDAFLAAAQQLSVEVDLVSDRCHVLAEEWPEGAFPVEFSQPDQAVEALIARGRERQVAGVLGTDDLTAVLAARVGQALGAKGNPPDAAERARHKLLQRKCLREAALHDPRIHVPTFLTAHLDDDPRSVSGRVSFPCVLKPVALAASRGVIRADEPVAFEAAFQRIVRLLKSPEIQARRDASLSSLLVESFIPGRELALEGLLEAGRLQVLALFDKPDPLDGPFFAETIYVTPSRQPEGAQREIVEAVAAAATALGLREGPVHAEVRLNESGVWILEVAARTIGGLCARTLRFGAGISLEELVVAHATGQMPASFVRERKPAGVMMIEIPRAGVYRGVTGVEEARAVPGVEDVVLTFRPGEHFTPLPDGAGYFGFIFARGETPEAVEQSLRRSHGLLRFELDPVLPVTRTSA